MKKIIFFILLILIVLLIFGYVVAFTQIGNNLLKPFLQSKINQYSPISLELKDFSLRPTYIKISAIHNHSMDVKLKAHFSLWNQNFQGNLLANGKIFFESEIKNFNIKSNFKGNIRNFIINASSNIANSNSHIQAKIESFRLEELKAKIIGLKIDDLLSFLEKSPYVGGNIDINADLKGNWHTAMSGKINGQIQKGTINSELAKKNLHINIPKDTFSLDLNADFENQTIKNNLKFTSNFGNISTDGEIQIPTFEINNHYNISLVDIAPLGLILSQNIRGGFKSTGILKGNEKNLLIQGYTDIANSDSKYSFNLSKFIPQKFQFDVKKISVDKMLWMFYKPQYIRGVATFMGNMSNSRSLSISGRVKANTNPSIIKKYTQVNIPDVFFTVQTGAMITDGIGNFDFNVESALGYFRLKNGDIDFNNAYANGNYDLLVRDLSKLKGLIGRDLNGKIEADGIIKYDKGISAKFQTTSLDGKINGRINPKNLYANFDGVNIDKLFDMLKIPAILNGDIQGDLNYDITSEKGKISTSIKDAKITHPQITNIFRKYRGIDTDVQVFEGANFFSNIDKGNLDAKLTMQSTDINLDSQYLKIDIIKNKISSKFKISSHQDYIYMFIDGNLNEPIIQLDPSELIKKATMKNIQKNADKAIKKILRPDNQEKVKKFLDDVRKNF
ncbi:hypothetical protein [Helicobacter cappadocius]|uniref:Uncharacterized protein n=1 Tax=Helicobacter cappadocius TaxID=3063998 RepID=A0AA90PKI3_9HELI|nr:MULTISPECIES: hypothetical protein [unclassified Helicobacter]MDO7253251.1 hypothetical protein [Helicobacter sp. faydin-H75]MDP2539175.1 hypothetical protein [Helicobacter sp. faydin-H76]